MNGRLSAGTHPLAPSLKQGGGMCTCFPSKRSPSLFQGGVGVGTFLKSIILQYSASAIRTPSSCLRLSGAMQKQLPGYPAT